MYNWGDVKVFSSVEQAAKYLEPIDIENGEYLLFDSEGRILDISVVSGTYVLIEPANSETRFTAQLVHMLSWVLEQTRGKGVAHKSEAKLEALVDAVLQLNRKGK